MGWGPVLSSVYGGGAWRGVIELAVLLTKLVWLVWTR